MESFLKTLKKLFPYNITYVLLFFSLPILVSNISDEQVVSSLLLFAFLKVFPFISLLCGIFFGLRHGFQWGLPISAGIWTFLFWLLFLADISFLWMIVIYAGSAALGCWCGSAWKQHHDEMYL